jgi:methylenetetrahydrofolate dehydrogenase (NADP+)/methenyltetrahydrofolate cyclohydrolase
MNALPSVKLIDGKATAARVLAEVREQVHTLRQGGVQPGLRNKVLRAEEVGIRSLEHRLPADTSQAHLLTLIDRLNRDNAVNGILVQLPLPAHIDAHRVLQAISPLKDVDGFHSENVGGLAQGRDVLTPCTPSGCMRLLRDACGELRGKHAVVVGRSNIVGKPMAALLLQADCTVTVVHSRSHDLPALCRQADILVAAVGKPRLIGADWLKPGAVVIDVGINRIDEDGRSRLVGDVDFAAALPQVAGITPVPGGVGPMTIAYLMKNTLLALDLQQQAAHQERTACLSPC